MAAGQMQQLQVQSSMTNNTTRLMTPPQQQQPHQIMTLQQTTPQVRA